MEALTEEQILQIIKDQKENNLSHVELAKKYECSATLIRRVILEYHKNANT